MVFHNETTQHMEAPALQIDHRLSIPVSGLRVGKRNAGSVNLLGEKLRQANPKKQDSNVVCAALLCAKCHASEMQKYESLPNHYPVVSQLFWTAINYPVLSHNK